MTKTTLKIELSCNGRTLALGPGEELDITKVTGLESSEYEVGLSDLAVVPGSSLDGRHIKARPIHIEGSFRSLAYPLDKRERLVRFFNPTYSGTLKATIAGPHEPEFPEEWPLVRSIDYELEGWTIKERRTLDARVGFVADLICPDPLFYGPNIYEYSYTELIPGEAQTGWTATFNGPLTAAYVKNEDTGERLGVTGLDLGSGQTLVLSTVDRQPTVLVDGQSAFKYIDRDSVPFKLNPGYARITQHSDGTGLYGGIVILPRYYGI